jgi:hypothetical protein
MSIKGRSHVLGTLLLVAVPAISYTSYSERAAPLAAHPDTVAASSMTRQPIVQAGNRGPRFDGSLTPAVDGAETPQAISDELAYKMLIASTLLPAAATGPDHKRQQLRLDKLRLSLADRAKFVAIGQSAAMRVNENAQRRRQLFAAQPSAATDVILKQLNDDDQTSLILATNQLRQSLSPDGIQRLDAFVQSDVKRKIKIFQHQ